ncbi:LacI family transcriptional regulator [Nocardioides luteus]|uniref:LacI family transcriptional regulator n=2 Tax=Nocardioides luteus TaxID=1844 RepID=A0ABQ5SR53_9ACTN|nr:LacI family transcriptional regulator [Nocardioides luteus]GLJ66610.1 LacI family transcriptional regulator [Nocardioides luteus]
MKDVAAAAGVSLKTVSRVVNGEANVNETLRTAVLESIAELGFRPNAGARGLRQGRSGTVGLLLEDVADPFYSILSRAVEEVAREHGTMVFAGSSAEDPARERELALAFCERRVDGLIVVPAGASHSYLLPEMRAGIPVVFVDRPPGDIEADMVLTDNTGGTRRGVDHLLAHGHRRIGFIGDAPEIYTAGERLRGYREALESAGIDFSDELVTQAPPNPESTAAALDRLLAGPSPATALLCGNSRTTVSVLRELARREASLALVGFDDLELGDLLQPGLTVVAQDPAAMGAAAARLLFQRITGGPPGDAAGDASGPTQTITIGTRLIARGSGEIPPP